MEGEDCGEWYVYAEQFGNDKLMALVVQKCAEKIEDVKLDSLLIQVSNAKFWLDVSESSERHPSLARLVAEFCILHKDQSGCRDVRQTGRYSPAGIRMNCSRPV